ncbi:hypothetical protein [Sphingomonas sanxanigenens]|uniref:Uncharacterized protein n=1 Tax=Sphingomonas sanxanigenens DSM 19645 = NX02 TaxID=1123269 RepID=W0AED9_9SPHN|nr:hypothetical protein [Sphingomonas sanxanigenens]AHE54663.1 hypothetical protein NX02_14895 [Sphingomonas sanxanigenens DSM 19645 = NX02]
MREPNLRTSRLAIAGGLIAAIAIGAAGFQLGRQTLPQPPPAATPLPLPEAPPRVKVQRVLQRAEIIALAGQAADALAAKAPLPDSVTAAAGNRFDLILPFGCDGPTAEGSTAPLRWTYDFDAQTLRIHVEPARWQPSDWGLAESAPAGEPPPDDAPPPEPAPRIEGFWIERPWSTADRCPRGTGAAAPADAQPPAATAETLAVAQFIPAEPRATAKPSSRAFDTVKRVAPEALKASQGFRIRLTGRIGSVPDWGPDRGPEKGPVHCIQTGGIAQRPVCAVAVTLDELRIENPESDDVLATWSLARAARVE